MNSVSSECRPSDVVDGLKVGIGVKNKIGISQLIDFSLKFMIFNEKVCSLINFVILISCWIFFFSARFESFSHNWGPNCGLLVVNFHPAIKHMPYFQTDTSYITLPLTSIICVYGNWLVNFWIRKKYNTVPHFRGDFKYCHTLKLPNYIVVNCTNIQIGSD